MYFLNRAALVLVAKQEFVDWIHSTPDDLDFITLKGIHEQGDPTVVLIPQTDSEEETENIIRDLAPGLLAAELAYFCEDEDCWPERLDHVTLRKFFQVMVESTPTDSVEGPLEREEM